MTGIGAPKVRGGGKNLKFPGAPERFGGQKSKSSRCDFRGEFPPPSNVRYVFTPPFPVSEKECMKQP